VVPAILILLSVPPVCRFVLRNRGYGYRGPRSLNSDGDWRRLNGIAGVAVIAAAFAPVAVKVLILVFVPELPYHPFIGLVDALLLLFTVAGIVAATEGSGPSRGV
jgi:hypothetical protein